MKTGTLIDLAAIVAIIGILASSAVHCTSLIPFFPVAQIMFCVGLLVGRYHVRG